MPPAFHFPEDQAPPSDLVNASGAGAGAGGHDFSKDVADHAAMYPMMNQIYKEFDHLSDQEKSQLLARTLEEEDYPQVVPEFESDSDSGRPKPKGIVKRDNLKGQENSIVSTRHVCFDPLALLLDASLEGELDLVKKTAREVSDPSAANDEGITALHNAICAGHFDIVRFLVLFGCDVNAQDSDGWTPLHCAASCNNLPMVKFLVEHGACIFATTFSDHETAAEKCEEDEEGFAGCSEYLYSVQEKLGVANAGRVFAVYDYRAAADRADELGFDTGESIVVHRKGDEVEKDWWWSSTSKQSEGYVPKNLLGMFPRVSPGGEEDSDDTGSSSSSASSYTMRDPAAMAAAAESANEAEKLEAEEKRRSTSSA
jgi:ankyrin repeat protein